MCIVMEMAEYSLDKVSFFISEYFLCTNISNMKSQVSTVINHDISKMKYCNMLLILYTAFACQSWGLNVSGIPKVMVAETTLETFPGALLHVI
jgi:hypothetical protein